MSSRKPGRPRRSEQVGHQSTQDKILQEAKRLFMKLGYAAVSINDIVEAAGVTKPTLYYYYPDKEHLYAAVLASAIEAGSAHYQDALSAQQAGSVEDSLARVIEAYLTHFPASMNLMLRDAQAHLSPDTAKTVLAHYRHHVLSPFERLFQRGAEAGEFEPSLPAADIAPVFLSQLDALYHWRQLRQWQDTLELAGNGGIEDPAGAARQFARLFIRGLR